MTNQWDQQNISVDVVPYVMDHSTNTLKIALTTRTFEPFKVEQALPGVLMIGSERAGEAATRALKTKIDSNVNIKYLKDIGISDIPNRDSRGPSLTIIMLAVIELGSDISENIKLIPASEAANLSLPFDHHTIIERTNQYVDQNILQDKQITEDLLGDGFSTKAVYGVLEEVHTGKYNSLDKTNLSRRLKTFGYVQKREDGSLVQPLNASSSFSSLTSSISSSTSKGRPSNKWFKE